MRCDCFGSSKLKRREEEDAHDFGEIERELLQKIRHLSYNELRVATDNFSHDNKIGRGGFGSVYKGVLKNGVEIAVKTLAAESKQGVREFLTEINIISNVKHQNLAWQLYEEGRLAELIDPELLAEYPEEQVMRYMKVAFFCTQAAANRRPLMSQVVDMLTTNTRLKEKQLTAPGFFPHSAPPFSTTHHFTSLPLTLTDIAPR
ncbi:hypothetical protein V2J09_009920 [Rumex salicifolius]